MASCVVCGDEETQETPFRQTSCGQHWMCDSCLEQTFNLAMRDESKYHPRCCEAETSVLLIDDYEDHLPFELAFDYRVKEREYSIQQRFRLYCGSKSCGQFIHPDNYSKDPVDSALCDACGLLTCVKCKVLFEPTGLHTCVIPEAEVKFQEAVKEHKYQRCTCSFVIELTEACNHISCQCGRQFCYICGEDWTGYHGCPAYGHPEYDEEGYNQDGFKQGTGLNREGRTRIGQADFERFGREFGADGYDEFGRDREGRDRQGFDEEGWDRNGYNAEGLNADGLPQMPDDVMEEHRMAMEAWNIEVGNFQPEEEAEAEAEGEDNTEQDDARNEGNEEQDPIEEVVPENETVSSDREEDESNERERQAASEEERTNHDEQLPTSNEAGEHEDNTFVGPGGYDAELWNFAAIPDHVMGAGNEMVLSAAMGTENNDDLGNVNA